MVLISKEGRDYRRAVEMEVAKSLLENIGESMLEVEIDMYPPDRRRRDSDNITKALFDSLQHAGVYGDDYQIERFTVERFAPQKPGFVVVRIKTR